jgi:hypothetical protein
VTPVVVQDGQIVTAVFATSETARDAAADALR